MNFVFSHRFDTDPEKFWKLFLSSAFNQELFRRLKMQKYEVIEQNDDGKVFTRVQRLEPSTPVPAFLQSAVTSSAYTEKDRLVWADNTMQVVIETAMFKDRFQMSGRFVVIPEGPGKIRREFHGDVRISVPFLGGKIEKFIVEEMRRSYDVAAHLTGEWLKNPPPQ